MAFKFLEELTPFILSAYEEANMKLGKFYIILRETLRESPEKSISFSEDGTKYISFIYYRREKRVCFSEGMTPKEKQTLYSRVRTFVLKNLIKKKFYADWFEVLQPAELVSIKFNPTDPIGVMRLHGRDIALMRAYFYDFRTPSYIEITILHEPALDPLRFLKEVKKEKTEKIQPITEEEEEDGEESREHIIGDDFDIVENTTNTDEENHGGDSTAHEVENGLSRDDGITAKSERSDDSAVPAPDTADDTTEDTQSDGFQGADGESGGDSASGENGIDTILDTQESSLSAGENHPQAVPNPDETAGSQEGNAEVQGGEGKFMDVAAIENAQYSCGEGVLSIIEDFLNERSFNPPKDNKERTASLVEKYKNEEIGEGVFKRLHRAFKKHLSVSSMGRESPTLDKKLLIKKLISFQSPYTAFKKDMTNEKVLLLVDVSDSMLNFYDLIPYFYRLTVVLKDVIVVVNYNMHPMSIIEKGCVYSGSEIINSNSSDASDEEFANKIYGALLKKYSVKTVINFTDFDGVDITAGILAKTNANMIIMDVYCCSVLNYQPFKDEKLKHLPEILKPFKKRITYYYGVGDFEGVIYVLNREL